MKIGKIELKKIKVALSMSRETLAFTCEVYLDKQFLGNAMNDGNGGCAHLDFNGNQIFDEILNNYDFKEDKDFYQKYPSEIFDKLINDYQNQKNYEKFIKKEVNHILLQKNDNFYTIKFNCLVSDYPKDKLIELINKKKSEGYTILNRNLNF